MSSPAPGPSSGKVRVLSANTRGFNRAKAEKIMKIATDNKIDLILLQECITPTEVTKWVDKQWTVIGKRETPDFKPIEFKNDPEKNILGKSHDIPKDYCGGAKQYIAIYNSNSSLGLQPQEFNPSSSLAIKRYVTESSTGDPMGFDGSSRRGLTQKVNTDRLKSLGLRPPQMLMLTVAGFESVNVLNNHAPQGGGSDMGYSGQDARFGHEVVQRVMGELTGEHLLIGDQNAFKTSLKAHYPNTDIVSSAGDNVIHAVASKGLKVSPIDLGKAGAEFKNPTSDECSDHAPIAVEITLSPTKP